MESSIKAFKVDVMESAMNPEILQAAIEERYQLEARLRSNPDFRRLEAVRRIIALYAPGAEIPVPIDPILSPEPAGSVRRPAPTLNPDPSPTNSFSSPTPSDPQRRSGQGLWVWGNSQASRIKGAAAEHLMETRKRATGGEIYKAIRAKGIEVRGEKPSATVSACLTSSPVFDHIRGEGYGLREWSNGGGT
jgi:hypothetical protein